MEFPPQPLSLQAIKQWPPVSNTKEVRLFIGLCGFHQRFITGYARIFSPLTDLSKKNTALKWEDIENAIRPIYEAEGFSLRHDSRPSAVQAGWSEYTAIATHDNGYKITASITLPLDSSGGKQNIQAAGSSSSYGVRYSTKLLKFRQKGDRYFNID